MLEISIVPCNNISIVSVYQQQMAYFSQVDTVKDSKQPNIMYLFLYASNWYIQNDRIQHHTVHNVPKDIPSTMLINNIALDRPHGASSPSAALFGVGVLVAVVVLGGIVVGDVIIELDTAVTLTEAVGKLKDVFVLARLQNCCARPSAVPSSAGHVDDAHLTISLVKFLL
jgi:hypothetical protein